MNTPPENEIHPKVLEWTKKLHPERLTPPPEQESVEALRLARMWESRPDVLQPSAEVSRLFARALLAMSGKLTACERERDAFAAVDVERETARLAAEERVRVLDEALVETLNTAKHLLGIVHAEDLSDVRGPEGQLEGEYLASRIAARLHERAALVIPEEGAG